MHISFPVNELRKGWLESLATLSLNSDIDKRKQ